jgi:thioredoxin 1
MDTLLSTRCDRAKAICAILVSSLLATSGCSLTPASGNTLATQKNGNQRASEAGQPQDFVPPMAAIATGDTFLGSGDARQDVPRLLDVPIELAADQSAPGDSRVSSAPPPRSVDTPEQVTWRTKAKGVHRVVLHASEATFDEHVLRAEVPVLVDFYASWCGPCQLLAPTLDLLAAETPQAKVVKIDIDDNPELAARYAVRSVPSLMVFRGGRVVARQSGGASKAQLKTMLGLEPRTARLD